MRILRERAGPESWVLDPFCGRGTTNFAARTLGLPSVGVDSSPVAVAITSAKLVAPEPAAIIEEARQILATPSTSPVPVGEFWERAYHPQVLGHIVRFREALLEDCRSEARIALRGILLGALHGPRTKTVHSYLSNQCPRTYAPKPAYAVKFWRERKLDAPLVDTLEIITRRAERYYRDAPRGSGSALCGDSREEQTFRNLGPTSFDWIITSPPYYGMRTYIPDQWLRNWFVGGPAEVEYTADAQLSHRSPAAFVNDLRQVWRNAESATTDSATLVVRFGGIADRQADPTELLLASFEQTGWNITRVQDAGSAHAGKRQADSFLTRRSGSLGEVDVWATLGAAA